MVEITKFDPENRVVVFETEEGKVKLSFDEWEILVNAYKNMVKI